MADKTLTGNGRPCPDCGGPCFDPRRIGPWAPHCQTCGDSGRVPIPPEEILAATLAQQ